MIGIGKRRGFRFAWLGLLTLFLALTGDPGGTHALQIADRRVDENLLVLYTFKEGTGTLIHDVSGVDTPLDLQIGDPTAVAWNAEGLVIQRPTVIQSSGNTDKITSAVQASGEITIEAWITSHDLDQDGPARIVTFSAGTDKRDFALGQGLWGDQPANLYDVRLRTTETDLNGLPSLNSPALLDLSPTHVVYTRDKSGMARLYVDGIERANKLVGGDFSTWAADYTLYLANEADSSRPWLGEYRLIAIYNRALSVDEVIQNYQATFDPSLPTEWMVAVDGTVAAAGTSDNPLSLKAAMTDDRIKPGDTVWLKAGAYTGTFSFGISGLPDQHITYRALPGEHVVINGTLDIRVPWIRVQGFEITDLSPDRTQPDHSAVYCSAVGCEILDNIIHDVSNTGILWYGSGTGRLEGNILYNNGYVGTDRNHGPGLYSHNDGGGERIIANNIFLPTYYVHWQLYSASTNRIRDYNIHDNILLGGRTIQGGGGEVENLRFQNNLLINAKTEIGYYHGIKENTDAVVEDNRFYNTTVEFNFFDSLVVQNNIFRTSSDKSGWRVRYPPGSYTYNWDYNAFEVPDPFAQYSIGQPGGEVGDWDNYTFSDWQDRTGFDSHSTLQNTPQDVEVIPLPYEDTLRLVIANWPLLDAVQVDLNTLGLQVGHTYRLRNVQNYYAEATEFVYDGSPLVIPMTGWTLAVPQGVDAPLREVSFPEFGVFIVEPVA